MERLKNRIAIIVIGIIICLISFCAFFYDNDRYIYLNKITQILDVENVEIKSKSIVESLGIGEWYICETYNLAQENLNVFFAEKKQNKLYLTDSLWIRKDWDKLPINSQYNEIRDMVVNYMATKKIEQRTNEMHQIISGNEGYYSFLCQPSIENPQKVLFFLLDKKNNKLFVVDLNF